MSAIEYASANVLRNNLEKHIEIIYNDKKSGIFQPVFERHFERRFDFCMCNPPFYTSKYDMMESKFLKRRKPLSNSPGNINESIYEGGEMGFVTKMLEESVTYRDKISIFSSLLGKKSSVSRMKKKINGIGGVKWVISDALVQGKTRRWVIAWSFIVEKEQIQCNTERKPLFTNGTIDSIVEYMDAVGIRVEDQGQDEQYVCHATFNVWNRKSRRGKANNTSDNDGFTFLLKGKDEKVVFLHKYGNYQSFESLFNHINRKFSINNE